MCNFFSCVSDRKGNVKFFKPEDIVGIMAEGNPKELNFNSHTSLMNWLGIKAKDEEKWSKWEYNPEIKELKLDEGTLADDKEKIKKVLNEFFDGKDILFLRNLYGSSSGNWNSGNRNSGHWNSGNWNSGHWNSGNGNSGNANSGNANSGHWNSGNVNSGNGVLNGFCTERAFLLFDKSCTKEQYEKIYQLDWSWFWINKWMDEFGMTADEKATNPTYKTTGGYLKNIEYKEAFKACPQSFIDAVKKLANFDAQKFEIITGLKV